MKREDNPGAVAVRMNCWICWLVIVGGGLAVPSWGQRQVGREVFGCHPNVGLGPLNLRTQAAFSMLRVNMLPHSPITLAQGQTAFTQALTWTNRWTQETQYTIDAELVRPALRWAYGASDQLEFNLEITACWRTGGIMDGLIEGFHGLFGFDQGGRDQAPRNDFRIELHKPDGRNFRMGRKDTGIGLEDLWLGAYYEFTCGSGDWPATGFFLNFKAPTGDSRKLFGSDGFDSGVGISLAKKVGDGYLYLSGARNFFGSEVLANIPLRNQQDAVLLAWEKPLSSQSSLILQYLGNTGPAVDYYGFSDKTHEITLGWKWAARDLRRLYEVGLLENIITFDTTPDFGLHFGVTHLY